MKILIPFLFSFLISISGICQPFDFRKADIPKFLNGSGDTLKNAFVGGLELPQFSTIDLNNDGIKDLFVFDKMGAKVLTFINKGTTGQVSYNYAPEYEELFPKLHNWALLVDYNYDGKEDIFTSGFGGIKIYKNTSGTTLSFTLITDLLLDQVGINVYTSPDAIPAITDVDNDGDIDVLAFGVLGGWVEYTRNLSKDLGYSQDSLIYQSVDQCWGSFEELASTHNANLGLNCRSSKYYKTNSTGMHSGSTLLSLDMDNDGDKDLIHGSITFNELIYLKNGKTEFSWSIDSMIEVDTIFPRNTRQASVSSFPAAFYVDVNNDGKRDLIVAPNDRDISKNINQVYYYKNTGTDLSPIFVFQQDNFLQDQMVDAGSGIAPAFFDYDLDGDNDLFAGTHGNFEYTLNYKDRILLYKNVGSATVPVYQLTDTNYLSLAGLNMSGITPSFGDLNKDGKKDLVFGDINGQVHYYQNQGGTPNTFTFVNLLTDSTGVIDVGSFSAPHITDIDRDGKQDLLIGELEGNFNYYRNTGTASPVLTLVSATFGNANVKDSVVQYNYDPNNGQVIDSFYVYESSGFSTPFVTDLDNDGDYELLSGSNSGRIHCYTNVETNLSGTFDRNDKLFYDVMSATTTSKYFGARTRVAVENLNPANKPDILIGNFRGGFNVYLQKDSITNVLVKEPAAIQFSVYPNPARENIYIVSTPAANDINVRIYNTLGQLLITAEHAGSQTVDISSLKDGMYILEISTGKNIRSTSRIAVMKP
jgi:hypothetical protein